jgi:hypothetical protein
MPQDKYDSALEHIMNIGTESVLTEEMRHTLLVAQNDALRCKGEGGRILITSGIAALGAAVVNEILVAIAAFDDFSADNDPWNEHDCAALTVDGIRVIWKIDYYDLSARFLSPDPADPKVTFRVLTVMRADEY